MTDPTFSIVVPTFRRPDALRETVAALCAVDYDPDSFEIIVVDDAREASTAKVVASVTTPDVHVNVVPNPSRGAAAARNHGARISSAEILLFCDDDIVVMPDHLRRHVATRRRHGDPLVNGDWWFTPEQLNALTATPFGRYRLELERWFHKEVGGSRLDDECLDMPILGNWNLAIRRELFFEIGGYDEDFPVTGAEDQDISLRARRAGCLLLLNQAIRVLHNDNRLNLIEYCVREERSAQSMPFMARKYPEHYGESAYVRENRPIRKADGPRLVAKKLVKSALAGDRTLGVLQRLTAALESIRAPEGLLRRVYSGLLGLYLFRGFNLTWPQAMHYRDDV